MDTNNKIKGLEENMKYKAIALDLDGTLTNSQKKVSEKNKNIISKAVENGIKVILASGRPLFGITPVADVLELEKKGGYILAYNGGNIVDCVTGELIYSRFIPQECVHDICTESEKNNVYAITYYKDKVLSQSDEDEYVRKEAFCNGADIKKVESLEKFVDYPVAKYIIVGEHNKLLPVEKALKDKHGKLLDIFFSEDYFLEVVPKGVAKDKSLNALLEKLNIKREELIACGDGMNDLPMIEYAGLGVAMENAYPKVKECADVIAPSNDNDGVAYIIEKYMDIH